MGRNEKKVHEEDYFERMRNYIMKSLDEDSSENQHLESEYKKELSKKEILSYFYSLQADQSLSDFEFFDEIGKYFKQNPKFFMISIYPKIRHKFIKIYGEKGIRVMDKYILEKYSLNIGEKIIYELNGTISQVSSKNSGISHNMNVSGGTIYITNQKIVAHGKFRYLPYKSVSRDITHPLEHPTKREFLYRTVSCYGYKFPIYKLHGLEKDKRRLSYFCDNNKIYITPLKMEEHVDKLFTFLNQFQIERKDFS
jgi:hypothetical protein